MISLLPGQSERRETARSDRALVAIQHAMGAYAPTADLSMLGRAYVFSARAHAGQRRKSGEPYLAHPLAVAEIMTRLKMDIASVAAALLHDVLEDTSATQAQIADAFGDEVAGLVDGVTKIGQITFRSDQEKQAENFRKMLVCMASDIRVLLIKLGDRLHNMRTLSALAEARRHDIAQETLDIYAPLANRLGIGWMKSALEDLCFQTLSPAVYRTLAQQVAGGQAAREAYIQSVISKVQATMLAHGLPGQVTGRSKHLFSVDQKMHRRGIPFEEIYDLMGVRLITDSKMNCYAALGLIHSLWMPVPGRFKDYIAIAKSNLYQSLHTTVIGPEGRSVEFQIRTDEMHDLAEEGIAAHWVYKEGGRIDAKDERTFSWLRQLMEWQREIPDTRQFMASVKTDLFVDGIYIFTPKGDVQELVHGATPIDFAYAVHTEVGQHCVGAKVNGRIVQLGTPLKNGDRVEILTAATQRPSKDWLKIVKTSRARTKIKHFIREAERAESREIGRRLLEQALRRERISPAAAFKSEKLLLGIKEIGLHSTDDLFVAVGYGKVSVQHVVRLLSPEPALKEGIKERVIQSVGLGSRPVQVGGISDILVLLSKCCHPLPGDRIVGFVTRGRGLAIHRGDCANVDRLDCDRERIIEVEWGGASKTNHVVAITVETVDKPGLLAQVSTAISACGANIKSADISTSVDQKGTLQFQIEVADTKQLGRALKAIEKVTGVLRAVRTGKK